MERKKVSKTKYLAVFATTTLIFIVGLYLGSKLTSAKLTSLENIEHDLRTQTMDMELQYLLLAENPCAAADIDPLAQELYQLDTKLSAMESQLGVKNKDVLRLKEYYFLLELRHWLFFKKTTKECNQNATFILYFYSNRGDCPDCEQQGYILSYLRKKYPQIKVYSFDINAESAALNTIKHTYGIVSAPAVIINNKIFQKYISKDELESIILKNK